MREWCGWPVVAEAATWEAAQQLLADAELSDGLPLVPPTQQRLEAMVAGVAKRNEARGAMPPMFGEISAEAVAYQCVIAGCRPAELPGVKEKPPALRWLRYEDGSLLLMKRNGFDGR